MNSAQRRRGFTLIEILVVAAIVTILTALILPVINQVKERGRAAMCASNMHQLGLAFHMYAQDHDGKYPWSWQPDPGPPPNPLAGNSNNWQAFLCAAPIGGVYLPDSWLSYNPATFAIRFKALFFCPTVAMNLRKEGNDLDYYPPPNDILNHGQWGYCYNATRSDLSYAANAAPYNVPQYMGVSVEQLWENNLPNAAILADGNGANWNAGPADWDAFTRAGFPNANWTADAGEWTPKKTHQDLVNVLFMDGHVKSMHIASAADKAAFNRAWYGGIPYSGGIPNPYVNW